MRTLPGRFSSNIEKVPTSIKDLCFAMIHLKKVGKYTFASSHQSQ